MTCIVGKVYGDHVVIGGDSFGGNSEYFVIRKDPKVFRVGDFVIGCTSSYRMMQLIRYKFTPSKYPDNPDDLFEYMVKSFIEELREVLKDGGWSIIHNNKESGGSFLVGIKNRLFMIDSDFQVSESLDGFASVGAGMYAAIGALHMRASLLDALLVSSKVSPYVKPPFILLSTNKKEIGVV